MKRGAWVIVAMEVSSFEEGVSILRISANRLHNLASTLLSPVPDVDTSEAGGINLVADSTLIECGLLSTELEIEAGNSTLALDEIAQRVGKGGIWREVVVCHELVKICACVVAVASSLNTWRLHQSLSLSASGHLLYLLFIVIWLSR